MGAANYCGKQPMIDYAHTTRELMKLAGVKRFVPIEDYRRAHSRTLGVDTVFATVPTDDTTLAIAAHEAGHVATSDRLADKDYGVLSIEYAATLWAKINLERLGIAVTAAMMAAWQDGLASYAADLSKVRDTVRDGTTEQIRNFILGKTDD